MMINVSFSMYFSLYLLSVDKYTNAYVVKVYVNQSHPHFAVILTDEFPHVT